MLLLKVALNIMLFNEPLSICSVLRTVKSCAISANCWSNMALISKISGGQMVAKSHTCLQKQSLCNTNIWNWPLRAIKSSHFWRLVSAAHPPQQNKLSLIIEKKNIYISKTNSSLHVVTFKEDVMIAYNHHHVPENVCSLLLTSEKNVP